MLPLIKLLSKVSASRGAKKSETSKDVKKSLRLRLSSNAEEVEQNLKENQAEISSSIQKALSKTAQQGVNIILDRTASSKGYKGGVFESYNEKYEQFRVSRGRGKRPDLDFTGKMLGSITTKAKKREANIFFTRAAESKKAAMNNKKRPFFGFSDREEKQLAKIFYRHIK